MGSLILLAHLTHGQLRGMVLSGACSTCPLMDGWRVGKELGLHLEMVNKRQRWAKRKAAPVTSLRVTVLGPEQAAFPGIVSLGHPGDVSCTCCCRAGCISQHGLPGAPWRRLLHLLWGLSSLCLSLALALNSLRVGALVSSPGHLHSAQYNAP